MDDADLDPAEEILARVLCLPAAERAAGLARACEDAPEHAPELHRRYALLERMGMLPDEEGTELAALPDRLGDFQILELLGEGGMGAVYRARQLSVGRDVALKIVRPELVFLPHARERFRREIDAVSKLQHPGIVPVYAVGEERGIPYFAMEKIAGTTLARALESLAGRDPAGLTGEDLARAIVSASAAGASGSAGAELANALAALRARTWVEACVLLARDVAHALAHVHARGLLHRDVKPSNLAIDLHGRVQLFDFGLASAREAGDEAASRFTRTGSRLGTLLYMSPEQVRGEELDARADVYGLGATLYEMLALRSPFHAATPRASEELILAGELPALHSANARVSSDLELVCRTALELDRERRYADAQSFARDLDNVLAHRTIEARAVGLRVRCARWAQRHPAWSVGLALSVLAGVGVPSALYLQQRAHAERLAQSLASETKAHDEALVALGDAEITSRFLGNLLLGASPERSGGRERSVRELLDDGRKTIGELDANPKIQARALVVLGDAYARLGRFDDALPLVQRGVAMEREQRGRLEDASLLALNQLATLLQRNARYEESERLFREALAGYEALHGHADASVAAVLNNLGSLCNETKRPTEAIEFFEQAAQVYESLADPRFESALSTTRINLGFMLAGVGRMDEACVYAQRALDAARAELKPPDPRLAQVISLAGVIQREAGELDKACELLEESLAMLRTAYGAQHDAIANALFNLGVAEEARAHREEAAKLYDEAIAMMDSLGLAGHPRAAEYLKARDKLRSTLDER
ncbi:MAG: serine/threonine protein kinase [Planctomycetes bacterium]|nr:serine/threonine protein kinase [Planctomycetota bacterium]